MFIIPFQLDLLAYHRNNGERVEVIYDNVVDMMGMIR